MIITRRWLSEFCELPESNEQLIDDLNRIGFEVESSVTKGTELSNIVVGHIQEMEAHPNADRLRIAQVDISSETIQIVTAATNVSNGDKIPVALPGANLANDLKIKKGKLRGIESNGMMCSAVECGLTDTSPGVWVLPKETPTGVDFIEHAQLVDTVFDIAILPNRGDCLSLYGLSRECCALYGASLKETAKKYDDGSESTPVELSIDSTICSYYQAKKISGISNIDTPAYFQTRLYYCGMRPISWIVDVTNIVMIEYGQPLHAFDAAEISTIKVKKSQSTSVTLLNEKEYQLEGVPIIEVNGSVGAVAGIMGALGSEVSQHTDSIVLESAIFDPVVIRKASKQLGVRSESSNRFEKGVDGFGLSLAVNRVIDLLSAFNQQSLTINTAICSPAPKKSSIEIKLDFNRINSFLGTSFNRNDFKNRLEPLGFEFKAEDIVSVPSWRMHDCTEWPDIAEEMFRFYGMEKISASPISKMVLMNHDPKYTFIQTVRDLCINQGITEAIPFPLSEKDLVDNQPVIQNPITPELSVLRSNGVETLLNTLNLNMSRHGRSCRLFSISPVWSTEGIESTQLSIIIQGARHYQPFSSHGDHQQDVDFYEVKGILSYLIESLGYEYLVDRSDASLLHPGQSATILVNNTPIGIFGMLHPEQKSKRKLSDVGIIDINLTSLLKCSKKDAKYQPVSKYPSTTRDVTYVMDGSVNVGDVLKILDKERPTLCNNIILCGYYHPKDSTDVNVSFRMTYQDDHETLSMEVVNDIHKTFAEEVIAILPCRFP